VSAPLLHIRHQGPVIASLLRTAGAAALQQARLGGPRAVEDEVRATLPPRPRALIADFVRAVGGDPGAWKRTVPPHFFPQWTFPLVSRTLEGIPYPIARVLNQGARMEVLGPIPNDEPLDVRARLTDIDESERRVRMTVQVVTGTPSSPEALRCAYHMFVPLQRGGGGAQRRRPAPPADARALATWRLTADEGLRFACLTGDFNPVHWVPAYARAAGFRRCILHGFASLARTAEALSTGLWSGDGSRLQTLEVRFTRPLLLPARVGLYVREGQVWVADAHGAPAYATGHFEARR
jgi:hypothetical protein